MAERGFGEGLVTRAESTPDNLRRRADRDIEKARKAEAEGNPDGAQAHRDQAFVKYAIAWGLLMAALAAATTADGKEFIRMIGTSLRS